MRRAVIVGAALLVFVLVVLGSMVRFVGPRMSTSVAVPQRSAPDARSSDGTLAVPVANVPRSAIVDTWGQSRAGGARPHHGTDIPAPSGTPVLAAADGAVEKLFTSNDGGTTLYVRSPDRRWSYYYAHLAGYAPGLAEGRAVRAGDVIAYVGDTGNAGSGNFHLHFGLSRMVGDDRWWQGEPVNPYPLLAGRGAGR